MNDVFYSNFDSLCGDFVMIDGKAFRIGELLNKGTDGRIYAASSVEGGADSAFVLKCFECVPNDPLWLTAMREIEAAKRLKRCRYTTDLQGYSVRTDGRERVEVFLLMKRLECCAEILPDERETLRVGADICRALGFIGRRGLIHGDVKPANLFRTSEGIWQLGDFGCMQPSGGRLRRPGSKGYRSPEADRGERCDIRADIYSLGITMYKLLSGGKLPFCADSCDRMEDSDVEAAIRRRLAGEPIPPVEGIGGELNEILLRMCAFDPRERFACPNAAARRLERLM